MKPNCVEFEKDGGEACKRSCTIGGALLLLMCDDVMM